MDIDELRNLIWEHLFQAKATKSIDEIAALTNSSIAAVGVAVDHEWFAVNERGVSIAYVASTVDENR
jgi:hypothetical protein